MKSKILISAVSIALLLSGINTANAAVKSKTQEANIIELSVGNYSAQTTAKGLVLVDFWAPWCRFCKKLSPILDEVALTYKDNKNIKFTKLNVENYHSLSVENKIEGLPTILVYKDGKEVTRIVGLTTKENIVSVIKKYTK